MTTEQYQFTDDGTIPNSVFPMIVYRKAFGVSENLADEMERVFADNNWKNAWRNGVYDYHHFHSIAHEVLGVYSGSAQLRLGGEGGKTVTVEAGDVLVLPAGTGHKKISASDDFGVVGAYPGGSDYDIRTGKESERETVLQNIAKVSFPDNDPVQGNNNGITNFWK
ncbi:hypothetical protein KJK34_13910 [Flavobacterium sp. D11R37]|uniref:hypothetical protein n=1 Tax=Flavobacterium coralii TaxID=2838017 RepID=UPI001CA73302|nr:hypothetical protein [Flavobacterium coralii]MBY8963852.1 hypothetical protein [Flavobacterium coralii]